MFFLLLVIVMPVYGQTAGSVQADKFDDEVIFRISGGLNYNSLCDKDRKLALLIMKAQMELEAFIKLS